DQKAGSARTWAAMTLVAVLLLGVITLWSVLTWPNKSNTEIASKVAELEKSIVDLKSGRAGAPADPGPAVIPDPSPAPSKPAEEAPKQNGNAVAEVPVQAITISKIDKQSAEQGSQLTVTISGTNVNKVTGVDFGAGVRAVIQQQKPTSFAVRLNIDRTA